MKSTKRNAKDVLEKIEEAHNKKVLRKAMRLESSWGDGNGREMDIIHRQGFIRGISSGAIK